MRSQSKQRTRPKQPANPRLVQVGDAEASMPAPKLYHFRDKPARILALLTTFSTFSDNMRSFVRNRLLLLSLLTLVFVIFCLAVYWHANKDAWRFGTALMFAGAMFVFIGYFVRSVIDYLLKKTPGPGAAHATMFFVACVFGVPILGSIFSSGAQDLSGLIQGVKAGTSFAQAPLAAALGVTCGTGFVILVLAWLQLNRYSRVSPQEFELYFCRTILQRLLSDLTAGAVCDVSFNPFSSEWSEAEIFVPSIRKKATFDCILDLRLDLSAGRSLSIRVIHRRTSKGRRKHKGYKHKIKIKYLYRLNGGGPASGNLRKSLVQQFVTAQDSLKDLEKNNPCGFLTKIPPEAFQVENTTGNLIVMQTFGNPCTMRKDLAASELPHPLLVLATCRAMCLLAGEQ